MKRVRIHTTNGRIDQGSDNLRRLIRSLKDGEYAVDVKQWTDSKTLQQLRGLHGPILREVCYHTGYRKDEAKAEIKRLFGEEVFFTSKFDGLPVRDYKSFRNYNKEQMSELISQVLDWVRDMFGVMLDLEEKKRYEWHEDTGELIELPKLTKDMIQAA